MCENIVTFHVVKGYGYRETTRKCGSTDPWGNRTICEPCSKDKEKMASIKDHEENMAADNAWLRSAGYGEM